MAENIDVFLPDDVISEVMELGQQLGHGFAAEASATTENSSILLAQRAILAVLEVPVGQAWTPGSIRRYISNLWDGSEVPDSDLARHRYYNLHSGISLLLGGGGLKVQDRSLIIDRESDLR